MRLLNRDRRGVTLTQPGETLRDSVDAIFQQVEQALRIARGSCGSTPRAPVPSRWRGAGPLVSYGQLSKREEWLKGGKGYLRVASMHAATMDMRS